MSTFIVADVGNSRIKWGLCDEVAVRDATSLPLDDAHTWDQQRATWRLQAELPWTVAGVNPAGLQRLTAWLGEHGITPRSIESHRQLPIQVGVDAPEQVGIDRLLNAVAFNSRESRRQGG